MKDQPDGLKGLTSIQKWLSYLFLVQLKRSRFAGWDWVVGVLPTRVLWEAASEWHRNMKTRWPSYRGGPKPTQLPPLNIAGTPGGDHTLQWVGHTRTQTHRRQSLTSMGRTHTDTDTQEAITHFNGKGTHGHRHTWGNHPLQWEGHTYTGIHTGGNHPLQWEGHTRTQTHMRQSPTSMGRTHTDTDTHEAITHFNGKDTHGHRHTGGNHPLQWEGHIYGHTHIHTGGNHPLQWEGHTYGHTHIHTGGAITHFNGKDTHGTAFKIYSRHSRMDSRPNSTRHFQFNIQTCL